LELKGKAIQQSWTALEYLECKNSGDRAGQETKRTLKMRKGECIMKAPTLTGNRVLTAKDESHAFVGIRHLLKKLRTFYAGSLEADWEKETGLPWREWGKYSDKNGN